MVGSVGKDGWVRPFDGLTQCGLLDRQGTAHREAVAFALDLPRQSTAQQIAMCFKEDDRLADLLGELSSGARALLTLAAFEADGVALAMRSYELDMPLLGYRPQRMADAQELERHGLVFAIFVREALVYHLPGDLQAAVRQALSARIANSVRSATAQRWLAAPRQDLADMAVVWTSLGQVLLPVTTYEGEMRATSKRRLLAVLPALDLPDPGGVLACRRLDIALNRLRDSGHLRLYQDTSGRQWKYRVAAVGDLGQTLKDRTAFARFFEGSLRYHGVVVCAQAMGKALAGQSVSLLSFGQALRVLMDDSDQLLFRQEDTPTELALSGLLPGWLRGELLLGLSQGKTFAVRFVPCADAESAAARDRIAQRLAESPRPREMGDPWRDPEADRDMHIGNTEMRWRPHEPRIFRHTTGTIGLMHPGELDDTPITLLSTLDGHRVEVCSLHEAPRAARQRTGGARTGITV